jgi:hypothetical protein
MGIVLSNPKPGDLVTSPRQANERAVLLMDTTVDTVSLRHNTILTLIGPMALAMA